MKSIRRSTIAATVLAALSSLLTASKAAAFSSTSVPPPLTRPHRPVRGAPSETRTTPRPRPLRMSLSDVSDFYAQFPLQAAVLTCGVKASAADAIAQVRSSRGGLGLDDLELRRNLAYVLYGGIFIGALCHYEYDVIFPLLFGGGGPWTSLREVLFDNFVSGPLVWLPPAYLIKAVVYDYPMREGLKKYVDDVVGNGLLQKYWAVWIPAQSVSFTVVPDHLRVAFMASVSFFWFILFSTVSSSSTAGDEADVDV